MHRNIIDQTLKKDASMEEHSTEILKNKNIRKLPTHHRLFTQQTKSSVNHSIYSTELDTKSSPTDSLDIYLSSLYNHESDLFVEKSAVVFQEQTIGQKIYPSVSKPKERSVQLNCFGHPLIIGNKEYFSITWW